MPGTRSCAATSLAPAGENRTFSVQEASDEVALEDIGLDKTADEAGNIRLLSANPCTVTVAATTRREPEPAILR